MLWLWWFDFLTCPLILFALDSQEYPEYVAYRTPLLFCDDWLNLYLDHHRMHRDPDTYQENNEISCSDYRFVYMGAKGLRIHVMQSLSLSDMVIIKSIFSICKDILSFLFG